MGVDDPAVGQDAGVPLVRLAEGELADVGAVGVGAVDHVGRHVAAAVAAAEALAAGGDEGEAATGQIAGVPVLDEHGRAPLPARHRVAGRAGELAEAGAVGADLVDPETSVLRVLRRVVAVGEEDAGAVEGEVGVVVCAWRELAVEEDGLPGLGLPVVEDDEAWADAAVSAEVLVAHVVVSGEDALVDKQAVEVEERVGEDDASADGERAARQTGIHGIRPLSGQLDRFLERGELGGQRRPRRGPLDELEGLAGEGEALAGLAQVVEDADSGQVGRRPGSLGQVLRAGPHLALGIACVARGQGLDIARRPHLVPDAGALLDRLLAGLDGVGEIAADQLPERLPGLLALLLLADERPQPRGHPHRLVWRALRGQEAEPGVEALVLRVEPQDELAVAAPEEAAGEPARRPPALLTRHRLLRVELRLLPAAVALVTEVAVAEHLGDHPPRHSGRLAVGGEEAGAAERSTPWRARVASRPIA